MCAGAWSPEAADIEARLEFVQGKLDEADRKAYEHGVPFVDQYSRWQLVNPDAPGSSFAAGASTPGLRGLRLATWNMGLAQADSFKDTTTSTST